ncbi:MAG: STAS/SEC14 domain-containing protein [Pontiella sp.]
MMLNVQVDTETGIALLEPQGALTQSDFETAAAQIDPFIEELGKLNGLIIHVEHFPGWDSFGALSSHLKFVREHHREIKRVAFVTDSPIGKLAEKLASHFVDADVKEFPFSQMEQARAWLTVA